MQSYEEMADAIEDRAPAQAGLLRYLLAQEEMEEAATICDNLGFSDGNFRQLADKLRTRGVELVCKRVHDPGDINENVRYVYGIRSAEVADWETLQKKKVMTAWDRMSEMFYRNIRSLGLDQEAVYTIQGAMGAAKLIIDNVDFSLSKRYAEIQAKEALAASEQAEAEELRAALHS
jgi:hypothetical protein